MKISASKRQLARIIRENGGWRDGAKFASQDQEHCGKQKVISFYINEKPWFRGGTFWRGNGVHGDRIETVELVRGWHQTILSRDEYFHLYPAPDADGWIEWKGGECPVDDNTTLDVKCRGGELLTGFNACGFAWFHDDESDDIIAYRLHKPESTIEQLCAVVTDHNKHEADPTIEQLASEYRNRQDYAERKQQEADAAKAEAEAKLAELVAAGKAVGLVLGVAIK